MKRLAVLSTLLGSALVFMGMAPQEAQAGDVGVSITVGQPGFYGHIDIGNAPQPRLIYAQPVIIERVNVQAAPVYLRVSPGHEKDWRKHCKRYNACGQNVYFVRDDWYRDVYAPNYQEREQEREHGNKNKDKHKDKHKNKHD